MHSPRRSRSALRLGWAAVLMLLGAGLVLLQADHAGFGWACLLVALALGFVVTD